MVSILSILCRIDKKNRLPSYLKHPKSKEVVLTEVLEQPQLYQVFSSGHENQAFGKLQYPAG
jgi:hypothetical protein